VDLTPPVITRLGTSPVTIEAGSTYTDAGATAQDNYDGDITSRIYKMGDVDTLVVGTYIITYNVSDNAGNAATTVTRIVLVADTTKPVITRLGNSPVTIEGGSNYTDAGATAQDSCDGNITSSIVKTGSVNTLAAGTYTLTYNVSDNAGNAATAVTRTVRVVDTTKPVITRLGGSPVTVEVGSAYTDAGATAQDTCDGNITNRIVKTSNVSMMRPGTYTVTYNVHDNAGNTATAVTRTVRVVDTTKPVITLIGNADVVVDVGETYEDAGATAYDNYDGNITSHIVRTNNVNKAAGIYLVAFNVSDSSGNAAITVMRTVRVVDTLAPVLTLLGDSVVEIEIGFDYVDEGATASDPIVGDITSRIEMTTNLNPGTAGTYWVTYQVSNSGGHAAMPIYRTVRVTEKPKVPTLPVDDVNNGLILIGTLIALWWAKRKTWSPCAIVSSSSKNRRGRLS
jgi:hypothetical protein